MKHIDAPFHVRGESEYVDDVAAPDGMLHAAVFGSPVAHGKIKSLDFSKALDLDGVVAIFTAADIPGENQIGAIIADEPALAIDEVHFIGHPIALVIAEDAETARAATHLCEVDVEVLPPVVHPREAFAKSHFIDTPRTFSIGDIDNAWDDCDVIVEGECEIAGQEHLYLETNRARAHVAEGGRIELFSSTQSPYAVQKATARVLGLPQHMVEVDVKRLGGGFGGKEDQATLWGVLAALGSYLLRRPLELVLNRIDDFKMTGKRHPYSADFKIGCTQDGRILAYDCKMYQNSGAAADLSTAVLERSLFHATNAYHIPNARIFAACCRTNLHPHTAFRGFGGPQAMFVIESAITAAAEKMNIPREAIQQKNLIKEGEAFPYGQTAEENKAPEMWGEAVTSFDYEVIRERVEAFNTGNSQFKKGLALMPICFGISFTKTFLNQASALVHVYTDGSISVSTGGIEMGQGVSTNVAIIAAREFGIDPTKIRVESTNTTRVANMSPSAASATTDLNGHATIIACRQILERLFANAHEELGGDLSDYNMVDGDLHIGSEKTEWDWNKLALQAYFSRVALSAHGFYATPDLNFDADTEKGRPFAYHVYGCAITEVTIDCLRGTYEIDWVKIAHDLGRPINPVVDLGQVEGAVAQGLGWMTLEELKYGDDGRLLSSALSTYKAPDVYFSPEIEVRLISNENPVGPHGSKAVGEPPLMYGIGVYFALRDAMRAYDATKIYKFDAPMTPEKVLMELHRERLAAPIALDELPPKDLRRSGPGQTMALDLEELSSESIIEE